MVQSEEKPIGLKVKEEQIEAVQLSKLACSMMDKKTRKILVYLINQELKRYKSYPKSWVEQPMKELEGIKAGIEMCEKMRRKHESAEQGSSSNGQSGSST